MMSTDNRSTDNSLRQRAEALLARSPDSFPSEDMKNVHQLAQELAIYQIELEMQNEELRDTQMALQETKDRYAALFEDAPVGYVVLDATGIIRQTNTTWRVMLNRPEDDYRGKPFADSIITEDAPIFLARFRTFFRNPTDKQIIVRMRRQGGAPFYTQIEARPRGQRQDTDRRGPKADATELMVIVSDVSDLRLAQQQIESQNQALHLANARKERINAVLQTIRNVDQLIVSEDNPHRLIEQACATLTEAMGYFNAWIALFDAAGQAIEASATSGFDGGSEILRSRLMSGQFPDCMRQALASAATVVTADPGAQCLGCPFAMEYGPHAGLTSRLEFEGRIYGILAVSVPTDYAQDVEELDLFAEVVGDLAFALHKIDMAHRLQKSQQRYLEIFGRSRDGFVMFDTSGRILDANLAFCDMLGYSLEELRSLDDFYQITPEKWRAWEASEIWERRLMGAGESGLYEKEYIRKDGAIFPAELRSYAVQRDDGSVEYLWATVRDITERKQAEVALHLSEERFRTLFQSLSAGSCIDEVIYKDGQAVDYQILDVNPSYEAIMRINREDALNVRASQLYGLKQAPFLDTLARVAETGIPARFETYFTPIQRHLEFTVSRPAPGMFSTVFSDITERKQAEEALAKSRAELQAIYDHAPIMICVLNQQRQVLYANPAFTAFSGEKEDLLRQGHACGVFGCVNAFEHPQGCGFSADCPNCALLSAMQDTLQNGVGHSNIEQRLTLDLGEGPKEVTLLGSTALIQATDSANLLLCLTDITDRKQAEDELRKRESLLQRIFDILPVGLWFADAQGTLLRGNAAGVRIWAAEPHVPITEYGVFKAWRLPNGDPVGAADWALARTIREGTTIVDELLEIEAFDGKKKTILNYTAPILDDSGAVEGAIVINLDISDRKALEDRLIQAQKMESVGRLAGGVAHDFNNMLGVILGHAELALEQTIPDQPIHADLEEIRKAAQRSAALTRQLLAFARKQTVAPIALDLNAVLEDMLKMLRRLIGEDIDLAWAPGKDLWPVKMDPAQIDQILANLCVNARDAIAGLGKITIETANAVFDEDFCDRHADYEPGEYVLMAVSDDGCGMDAGTRAHVFEPFYTTKEMGKGTGLGLATVYGAVRQNNGFINVYSEPGQGTTFRIYLPRHNAHALQETERSKLRVAERGAETILLVEDEPGILTMTTLMLERLGYTVLAADAPGEAIRLAREHSGPIDLVITDVIMPEMNGRDLVGMLMTIRPDLNTLFMSGYTADSIGRHGVLDEGVRFIQKPFSMTNLAAKIREALK